MPVPPKHPSERRRRNATLPMTQLPAGGRQGPTPPWPLSDGTSDELAWWERLWPTPQAAAWDRHGMHLAVARYCRLLTLFDSGGRSGMSNSVLVELRNLEDRLGLNPVAMLKLRWEVSADEVAEARTERPAARPRVVDPDAVAGA